MARTRNTSNQCINIDNSVVSIRLRTSIRTAGEQLPLHYAGAYSLGLFVLLLLLAGYVKLHGIPSWLKQHCGKIAIGLWMCLTLGVVMMNYLLVNYHGAEGD